MEKISKKYMSRTELILQNAAKINCQKKQITGGNVVIRLSRNIPVRPNRNHKLFFDNYFTSPDLQVFLAKKEYCPLALSVQTGYHSAHWNQRQNWRRWAGDQLMRRWLQWMTSKFHQHVGTTTKLWHFCRHLLDQSLWVKFLDGIARIHVIKTCLVLMLFQCITNTWVGSILLIRLLVSTV